MVGKIPQICNSKKGKRYPETRVICGIALKINAAIRIQNAYLSVDLDKAYAPKVPKKSDIETTKTVTIMVFLDAFQNSPSVQASEYAFEVNWPPVSNNVLNAEIACHH